MDFKHARSTCVFALAGSVNAVLSTLYYAPLFLERYGAMALARELTLQLVVNFIVGLGVMLALSAQLAQPAQALRRPGRFVLVLAVAAAPLCWLAGAIEGSVRRGYLRLRVPHLPDFLEGWLTIFLWGGLFSWLYLLYLQRREDRLRLDGMLAKRAVLARQLAQAELLAARALIDPVMVAGVLRKVQARYADDPAQGAALLEQLIGYLRLALNRSRRDDAAVLLASL